MSKELIEPVTNDPLRMNKPNGGLWTSDFKKEIGSDWVQCYHHMYGKTSDKGFYCHLIQPKEDAKIYVIDNYEDCEKLYDAYSYRIEGLNFFRGIDFEKMAKDYDGLRLTSKGQRETRLTHPYDMYGWDCQSTVYFRWCFEVVMDIGWKSFKNIFI